MSLDTLKGIYNIKGDDEIWKMFSDIKSEDDSNDSLFSDGEVDELDIDNCKYCKSDNLVNDDNNGIVICKDCGRILDKIIDSGAEWRYYGVDDSKSSDPTRCGLPSNALLPESSLGTIVGLTGHDTYEMRKIRKYHTWNAMPYRERSLYSVFDQLTVRAVNNGIPSCIIEDAKAMYKVLSEHRISRGSNRKGLIASCIYIACKSKGVPRSAKEVAEIFKLKITSMTKGCKKFMEIMNTVNKSSNLELSATQPDDFIRRFCSKLQVTGRLLDICRYVAKKAEDYNLVSENTPPSIAAGSIYLVSASYNMNISKKDISEACKISEVTISKCYKKLNKYKKYLLPVVSEK
jgi:transcription initiation factor TFIIB